LTFHKSHSLIFIIKPSLFQQELRDCKSQMTDLTNKWYQAIRIDNNTEDDDEDPETISQRTERTNSTATLNSSRGNMI